MEVAVEMRVVKVGAEAFEWVELLDLLVVNFEKVDYLRYFEKILDFAKACSQQGYL